MSIRAKVVLLLLVYGIAAYMAERYLTQVALLTNSEQLLDKTVEKELKIVRKNIEEKIRIVDATTRDYAYWDDTYTFMADKNQEFIDSNLLAQTFTNISVDYMVFYDTAGKIFYKTGFQHETGDPYELTQPMIDELNQKVTALYAGNLATSGIITLGDKVFLISSRPILKSDKAGPAQGSLMFLRELDEPLLAQITELIQIPFITTSYEKVKNLLDKSSLAIFLDKHFVIANLNGKKEAFVLMDGIDNNPALVLQRTEDSAMLNIVKGYRNNQLITFIVVVLINTFLCFLLITKLVITPTKRLVTEIDKIRNRKVSTSRITVKNLGELQILVDSINGMLESLDNFDKKLFAVNKEMEEKTKELQENSVELERLNKHMVGRELRMAELKEQIEDLKFKLNQQQNEIQ